MDTSMVSWSMSDGNVLELTSGHIISGLCLMVSVLYALSGSAWSEGLECAGTHEWTHLWSVGLCLMGVCWSSGSGHIREWSVGLCLMGVCWSSRVDTSVVSWSMSDGSVLELTSGHIHGQLVYV